MKQKFRTYATSTFASLAIYNYRLYFFGQGISLIGTWLQTIAQTWLIFTLTKSGTYIGVLTAVQFLPILVLGPIGGLIADRLPKRRILYMTQAMAMMLACTMSVLILSHVIQIWMVFVMAALLGLIQVVDNPTRQTFIMEMVGKEYLANAVTLNSIEVNMARIIGPAIAGGLIVSIGIGYCFLVNGISYVAVILSLVLMRGHELHPYEVIRRSRGQLREGFRYVQHHPLLRNILLIMAVIGTFSYEFPTLLPIYANTTFHAGASGYSLLMGAMGVGSVIGGFITANRRKPSPTLISIAAISFGASMLLAATAPNLWTAACLMVLVGIGSISFTAIASSTLQLQTTPNMRGRVMALWTMAFLGSTPIGGPIIGYISEHSSPRVGMITGGIAAVVAGFFALYTAKRTRRQLANSTTAEETVNGPN